MFENDKTLWVVHISNNEDIALRAQKEGFICIGWTRLGNLTMLDTRDMMKAAYKVAFPDAGDGAVRASYGQPFRFAHEMAVGDPVVYPIKDSRELLIGKIVGPYRWADDDRQLFENDYCNLRRVEWLKQVQRVAFTQDALHSFGAFTSVSTSSDYLEEVNAVLNLDVPEPTAPKIVDPVSGTNPIDSGASKVNLAERAVEETKDFLLRQWSRTAQRFEVVVAAVFRAMGYSADVQQGTHDLGVDVIAHPDPLGVQPPLLKIQVKSGTGKTDAKTVKELRGLLNTGEKGVLVSLGGFSIDARHVQQNDANLILVDFDRFVSLFLAHYEKLDAEMRIRFPLRSVYIYVG
ncbi:MAG: restriction endonuclease [Sphingobium sp.]